MVAGALHQPLLGRSWKCVKSWSPVVVRTQSFRAVHARVPCTCGPHECRPPGLEAVQQGPSSCDGSGSSQLASLQPASLSRAMIAVQPGRVASSAFRNRRGLTLPGALLVFALTAAAAVWTGVRSRLQAVRDCQSCKGYGIKRCKLCAGSGKIRWEGKMAHDEPCPMCLGRRYTRCSACGGHFARTTFMHLEAPGDSALLGALAGLGESTSPDTAASAAAQQKQEGQQLGDSGVGLIGGGRGMMSRKGRQQIMEEVNRLADEIMTD